MRSIQTMRKQYTSHRPKKCNQYPLLQQRVHNTRQEPKNTTLTQRTWQNMKKGLQRLSTRLHKKQPPPYNCEQQKLSWGSKKVREKSRGCHNHKPQPFPDPKRKRKLTNPNKHKSNKRTKSTKISSLFPKRGNRNTKRTENHKNKMTHGKTNRSLAQSDHQ